MKPTIHIFYTKFADLDKQTIIVGGAQNYFLSLCKLFIENGFTCKVYQFGNNFNNQIIQNIEVFSFPVFGRSATQNMKKLFRFFSKKINSDDLIIWGSENIGIRSKFKNVIAIQHGIAFDMLHKNGNVILTKNIFTRFFKQLQCFKARKNFLKFGNIVCVDYNYLNWIRTQLPRNYTDRAFVIPNYAEVENAENINSSPLADDFRILFARRFSYERGVEILFELIPKVVEKYPFVKFTVCGDGPYKDKLEKEFLGNSNVKMTQFAVGESTEINLQHHVTLIPTIGSEGTSFSLLEGMACGCIPIISNVGGMTNVILNGFNGFIVEPNVDSIFESICKVINLSNSKRLELSEEARNTVKNSFSLEIWKSSWMKYINKVLNDNREA